MKITFQKAQEFLKGADTYEVNGEPHSLGFNDPWCNLYISSSGIEGYYLAEKDTKSISVDPSGALIFLTNRRYEPIVVIKSFALRTYGNNTL